MKGCCDNWGRWRMSRPQWKTLRGLTPSELDPSSSQPSNLNLLIIPSNNCGKILVSFRVQADNRATLPYFLCLQEEAEWRWGSFPLILTEAQSAWGPFFHLMPSAQDGVHCGTIAPCWVHLNKPCVLTCGTTCHVENAASFNFVKKKLKYILAIPHKQKIPRCCF